MEIEEKVKHLAEIINDLQELFRNQTNARLTTVAMLDALQQGLQEACARLGLSEEQFSPRFEAAARWHYDHLLGKATDADPNLAAEIDTRTIDQVPTDELPPRIFP